VAKGTVHRAAAAQDRGSLPYGDTMLELISIIAGLAVCILIPIELGKIRKGWVHKKFAGDRPRFLAAYRVVKVVGAVIWLTVSGLSFNALRELAKVPDTEPSTLPPR
jgi:hypothetical protein